MTQISNNKIQSYTFESSSLALKLGLLVCFLLLIISRSTLFFTDPRFWAEEATLYFSHAYTHSLSQQLTFVAAGYYSLVSVVSTAFAHRLVSLESAPFVTTIFALSIQLLPAIIILFGNIQSFATIRLKIIALLLLLFVMPNSEVWLNVVNSQFYLAIVTALILINHSQTRAEKIFYSLILLVSGLTGLISLFLLPLFFFKAFSLKDNEKWIQSAVLLFTGLIQAYFILTSDNGLRQGDFDALTYVFIFIIKVCLLPILGADIAASVIPIFRQILSASWPINYLIVSIAVFFGGLFFHFIKKFLTTDARYLFAASLFLFFFSVYGALGDKSQLINALGSERYFTAPNTLFYLSLLGLLSHDFSYKINKKKWFLQLIILLVLISGLLNFWSDKNNANIAGPSWKQQILQNQDGLRNIMIWPKGWFVNLNKSDNQMLERCQKNQFLTNQLLCLIYKTEKLKIKILLIKNAQNSQQYDLLTYKILENRNPSAFPNEIIYRDLYLDSDDKRQDVKLKILQGNVFFSAVLMAPKSL